MSRAVPTSEPPRVSAQERARRNRVLALVHVALALAILAAFVWLQGRH